MKQKILSALKNKYQNLGFGDKAFDGVADYLSSSVTEEGNIETAINGVEPLLKAFQGDIDKVRGEKTNLQKELDELKAKSGGKTEPTDPPKPSDPNDWESKMKELFEKEVKPIKDELSAYKQKESLEARQTLITNKAKELGIPEWRIKEGFIIADDADEALINSTLSAIKTNIVTAGLDDKKSSGILSSNLEKSNQEADNWAKNLPDAKKN